MKSAIIVHGMPSKEEYFNEKSPAQSNKHWLPWLQRQLILNGVLAQSPEMPEPYEPVYEKWLSVFEQFHIDEQTMLIGHSCGAGFLIRWLSENNAPVGKVALVAPFLDPDRDEVKSNFFEFEIDSDLIGRTKGLNIFFAPDDDQEILTSVDQLRAKLPNAVITVLPGRKHFTFKDMQTEQFPELADWLLS
jgi:predicted alpha/beta hydrolase family esterase